MKLVFIVFTVIVIRCRPPWTDPRKMFSSPTTASDGERTNAGAGVSGSNPGAAPTSASNGVTTSGQTIDNFDGNNGNAVSPGKKTISDRA